MQLETGHLTKPVASGRRWWPATQVGYVWLIIALLHSALLLDTANWQRSDVLVMDAGVYYVYLPSAFLTKDLGDGSYVAYVRQQYRPDQNPSHGFIPLPNGRTVFKYSLGMAVMDLPWFAAAHAYAAAMGYPTDGYSLPYQLGIALGCMLYGLLGLWVLGRELRHYVPDNLAALTLLAIGLGTNLFIYNTLNSPMTHATLFMLNVLLLRYTRRWYASGEWSDGLKLALVFGLVVLVRPSELWMAAVPLFWGFTSWAAVTQRFTFWLRSWQQVLAMVGVVVALASLQFIFWRVAGGQWYVEFYATEGFTLSKPHLWEGLFSVRKGWLFWSPLLALALLGCAWLRRTAPAALPVVVALVPAVVYITFTWSDWTYGGGFGARTLISLYPLLSLGLASLLARWWHRAAVPLALAVCLLVAFSVRQSWQFSRGGIDCCNENWPHYKEHFFDH
jgi:hypothetical protein